MIQDDEYEVLVTTPERVQALGFKPQKEILINHILPYASELDEESSKFLTQVKDNFGKAVVLREMKPACGVWSSRLMKYIRIYGLKFSKEDHIALIKLAYELVLIPDLEPCKIHKFSTMFLMLAKKRYLITPEELTLPWRPLYDMGRKIFDKNDTQIGMYHYQPVKSLSPVQNDNMISIIRKFLSNDGLEGAVDLFGILGSEENELPTSLEGSYMSMVKCAKHYFPLSASKEIIETILPYLNPWSSDAHIMSYLPVFLPVALNPKHASHGHELWFDKLMDIWDNCYNSNCGISDLLLVFAGLAKKNPGAINWSPYVPQMFSRFLHAFNLPVSYKDMQYTRSHSLEIKHMAAWIVWSIRPDGVVLNHLRSFCAGVESYMHSANAGRWSLKLRDLLRKLAVEFLNRVRREREKRLKESWENKTPEDLKLRDEDITEFVKIVLEPTLHAVFGRSGLVDITIALQSLATLRPNMVVPPLIERMQRSMTSLTEPHRVTAAMSAVAAVARPMLRGPESDYPEGPTHVVPLLTAILPGLDPNDLKKTIVTLHFIIIFSWMVPYIDCSSAHEYWPDLTEEEILVCESTAQLEDFVLVFFDRLFVIIESSIMEHARLETKESDLSKSKTDTVIETAISTAAIAVLMQSSPKIFKEALRKFKTFATQSTYETNVSGSMVGVLLRVFARVDSKSTLAAFVPKLCDDLMEILSSDEILSEENPPRDLVYRIVLLMNVVECNGVELLPYIPKILPVLDKALKLHSVYTLTRSAEILSHIFQSLSLLDLKEWRSFPYDYGEAPQKWLPIREWGKGCLLKDTNFSWHVPNSDEAACAQMLVDRYLKPEIKRLRQWISGERDMSKERRLRSFYIINAVLSCASFMPPATEEPAMLLESLLPATSLPYTNGVNHVVTLDGQNVRSYLTDLLTEVQAKMLNDKTDDTKGLEMLIQVWERLVVLKNLRSALGLESQLRSYGALERALDGRGGPGGSGPGAARLRMLIAEGARLQDVARLDLVCISGITPSALKALDALYELSINTYTSVRVQAQGRLYWMLSHFPYSYRAVVPKLASLFTEGGEGDEWHARQKGAMFIMLGPKAAPLLAKQDWEIIGMLWPSILKAPLSEKPSILKLELAFVESIHRNFPTVNTKLTIPDAAIDAAKLILPKSVLDDPSFKELVIKSVQTEIDTSVKTEKAYFDLIQQIINVAEMPNIQWRRLELAMQILTNCPSVQTKFPPEAVSIMLRCMTHDNITVRKIAQKLTHLVLKQQKRELKKIWVDPYELAGVKRPKNPTPGYRPELEWAMWSKDRKIETDEEWEKPFLRDIICGFYEWPEKIQVSAPSNMQQNSSDLTLEEMNPSERHIFEFFSNEENVDKIVSFMTVEEKKGKDKFNGFRFILFRALFAQFGEDVSDKFIAHALRCAASSQEAPQRFASEIAAAALRATRYWSRKRALAMLDMALNIIKTGLSNVIPETMEDWGTCVATGVQKLDPTRGSGVFTGLLEFCTPSTALRDDDKETDTSFVICARLYALQGAINSLRWRGALLARELLTRLEMANFTQHPYQNVRETVGSMLLTIFDTELVFTNSADCKTPLLKEFLESVKPRLKPLQDENGDFVIKTALSAHSDYGTTPASENGSPDRELREDLSQVVPMTVEVAGLATDNSEDVPQDENERQPAASTSAISGECSSRSRVSCSMAGGALAVPGDAPAPAHHAISLLTTVLRGCMTMIIRGVNGSTYTQYTLVRPATSLAARGPPQPNDELPRAADGFLASLALANHDEVTFDYALDVLDEIANSNSWWSRLACLEFAQPLLFYGLPLLCQRPERAQRAESLALKLMRDTRIEVRQSAAKLLTGLMHCQALPNEDNTIKRLMKLCRSKILVDRHCGVLGLCAYLTSRPYSLGPKLGLVLAELSRHSSAPDPIPAAIRVALSDFRRTHQDDWPKHREQLTEEELDLLADLTSPPSYCA